MKTLAIPFVTATLEQAKSNAPVFAICVAIAAAVAVIAIAAFFLIKKKKLAICTDAGRSVRDGEACGKNTKRDGVLIMLGLAVALAVCAFALFATLRANADEQSGQSDQALSANVSAYGELQTEKGRQRLAIGAIELKNGSDEEITVRSALVSFNHEIVEEYNESDLFEVCSIDFRDSESSIVFRSNDASMSDKAENSDEGLFSIAGNANYSFVVEVSQIDSEKVIELLSAYPHTELFTVSLFYESAGEKNEASPEGSDANSSGTDNDAKESNTYQQAPEASSSLPTEDSSAFGSSFSLESETPSPESELPLEAEPSPDSALDLVQGSDAGAIIDRAMAEIGKPYAWGAVGPQAYDAGGLVSYACCGQHVRIGTTATFMTWERVSNPQPGDICVKADHCGIYAGGGTMVHAPTFGQNVCIGPVQPGMIIVRY